MVAFKFDLDKKIKQVSAVLRANHNYICGLKFIYEDDDFVEEIFCNGSYEWVTKDIPNGYEIIGMFVNTKSNRVFEHFGFNLLPIDR